jgi:hypothetical protein
MEIETIIKVIGAIVAISSAGKIIYDITTGKNLGYGKTINLLKNSWKK